MAKIVLTKKEVERAITKEYGDGEITFYKNGKAQIDTTKNDERQIGFARDES